MYIHPEARLNHFEDVKIPSTNELVMQFGFKAPQGHGDESEFGLPDNAQGLDNLDRAMIGKILFERNAAEFEAGKQQAQPANVPASNEANELSGEAN